MKKLLLSIFLLHSCCIFGMANEENQESNLEKKSVVSKEKDKNWYIFPLTEGGIFFSPLEKAALEARSYLEEEMNEWFIKDDHDNSLNCTVWWYNSGNKRDKKKIPAVKVHFNSIPDSNLLGQLSYFLGPLLFKKLTVVLSPGSANGEPPCDEEYSLNLNRCDQLLKENDFKLYNHPEHEGVEGVKFWDET